MQQVNKSLSKTMNDALLIWEAYTRKPSWEGRFQLLPTKDGFVIIDNNIKGPNKTIERFDHDQEEDAKIRFNYYNEPISRNDISQGFKNLRKGLTEDPDAIAVNQGDEPRGEISWELGDHEFVAPFMKLGDEWVVGWIDNPTTWHSEDTHSDLMSNRIIDKFYQIMGPRKLPAARLFTLLKNNPLIMQYKKQQLFDNEFLEIAAEQMATRDKNHAIGYIGAELGDIYETHMNGIIRKNTMAGRVWINPTSSYNEKFPGLFISTWVPMNEMQKKEIEQMLSNKLSKLNLKWSRIVWDGDKNIDPTKKHISASQKQAPALNWDDIKYA